jgi:pyruvate/2-oxoglutarate dehydrogenase complex dihydrolipoamide acyltransferase (E2) component
MRKSKQNLVGQRHEVRVPDTVKAGSAARAATWMVELGEEFCAGDRLLELEVDGAEVRILSPAAGKLAEIWVEEEESVKPGQLVAVVVGE